MNKSRPVRFAFRASDSEAEQIRAKVAESGLNQQQYIIEALLNTSINVRNTDGLKEFIPELKRIGNNLNQTARSLNEISAALNEKQFYSYKKIAERLSDVEKNQKELSAIWLSLNQYLQKQK